MELDEEVEGGTGMLANSAAQSHVKHSDPEPKCGLSLCFVCVRTIHLLWMACQVVLT